jgi:hypothetical protein
MPDPPLFDGLDAAPAFEAYPPVEGYEATPNALGEVSDATPGMCGLTSYNCVEGHFFLANLPSPDGESINRTIQGVADTFESQYDDPAIVPSQHFLTPTKTPLTTSNASIRLHPKDGSLSKEQCPMPIQFMWTPVALGQEIIAHLLIGLQNLSLIQQGHLLPHGHHWKFTHREELSQFRANNWIDRLLIIL